jgi:hypothetical protein
VESGARYFVVAAEVSTIGCAVGEKNEILGRVSRAWYFALLGTRIS